mgnify:CR=1 FL=1
MFSDAGPAAYLLRLSSLHQRHFRSLATLDYIQGSANAMADDCSRLWHLNNSQLLAYFNARYPQRNTWKLCHLQPAMVSSLLLALHKQWPAPQSFLNVPKYPTVIGQSGQASFTPYTLATPTSLISRIPSRSLKSSLNISAVANSPPAVTLSDLAWWRTTFVPLARR